MSVGFCRDCDEHPTCPDCNGTGYVPDTERDQCPTCENFGELQIEVEEYTINYENVLLCDYHRSHYDDEPLSREIAG
jgi:DnaJ-class molecular chaperone